MDARIFALEKRVQENEAKIALLTAILRQNCLDINTSTHRCSSNNSSLKSSSIQGASHLNLGLLKRLEEYSDCERPTVSTTSGSQSSRTTGCSQACKRSQPEREDEPKAKKPREFKEKISPFNSTVAEFSVSKAVSSVVDEDANGNLSRSSIIELVTYVEPKKSQEAKGKKASFNNAIKYDKSFLRKKTTTAVEEISANKKSKSFSNIKPTLTASKQNVLPKNKHYMKTLSHSSCVRRLKAAGVTHSPIASKSIEVPHAITPPKKNQSDETNVIIHETPCTNFHLVKRSLPQHVVGYNKVVEGILKAALGPLEERYQTSVRMGEFKIAAKLKGVIKSTTKGILESTPIVNKKDAENNNNNNNTRQEMDKVNSRSIFQGCPAMNASDIFHVDHYLRMPLSIRKKKVSWTYFRSVLKCDDELSKNVVDEYVKSRKEVPNWRQEPLLESTVQWCDFYKKQTIDCTSQVFSINPCYCPTPDPSVKWQWNFTKKSRV